MLSLLKQEPLVERWEDAPQKEGGSGCMLAYMHMYMYAASSPAKFMCMLHTWAKQWAVFM